MPAPTPPELPSDLATARAAIDDLDNQIVDLLIQRFIVTRSVGKLKRVQSLSPRDRAREKQLLLRLRTRAEAGGLDPSFLESLYHLIITEVRAEHAEIPPAD